MAVFILFYVHCSLTLCSLYLNVPTSACYFCYWAFWRSIYNWLLFLLFFGQNLASLSHTIAALPETAGASQPIWWHHPVPRASLQLLMWNLRDCVSILEGRIISCPATSKRQRFDGGLRVNHTALASTPRCFLSLVQLFISQRSPWPTSSICNSRLCQFFQPLCS